MKYLKETSKDFKEMVLELSSEIDNAPYILSRGDNKLYQAFGKSSGASSSGSGNCGSSSNSGRKSL